MMIELHDHHSESRLFTPHFLFIQQNLTLLKVHIIVYNFVPLCDIIIYVMISSCNILTLFEIVYTSRFIYQL